MPVTELAPTTEQIELGMFILAQVPGGHVSAELKAAAEATLLAALKDSV